MIDELNCENEIEKWIMKLITVYAIIFAYSYFCGFGQVR